MNCLILKSLLRWALFLCNGILKRLQRKVMFKPCYMSDGEKTIKVNHSIDFVERSAAGWFVSSGGEAQERAMEKANEVKAKYARMEAALKLKKHQEMNPLEDQSRVPPEVYVEAGVSGMSTDAWKVEDDDAELEDLGTGTLEGDVTLNENEADDEKVVVDFDSMTKQELLLWAEGHGHDLRNNARKSELLRQCKAIYLGL